MRLMSLISLVLFLPVTIPTPREQQLAEKKELRRLESVMIKLARGGRTEEVSELLFILLTLGFDSDSAQSLMGRCNKELARASKRKEKMPSEAKTLRDVAAQMAARLKDLGDDGRRALAQQILLLDDDVAAAHLAIGHQRIDGAWRSDRDVIRLQYRQRISEALAQARALEIEVVAGRARACLRSNAPATARRSRVPMTSRSTRR